MPLTWDELAGAHPLDFTMTNAPQRLAETGDRWHDALTRKQSLEKASAGQGLTERIFRVPGRSTCLGLQRNEPGARSPGPKSQQAKYSCITMRCEP